MQRNQNGAEHKQSRRKPGDDSDHKNHERYPRRPRDALDNLSAGPRSLLIQSVCQSRKLHIDGNTVLTSLSEKGVPDNVLIVGIFVDRAHCRLFELAQLFLHCGSDIGAAACESVQTSSQAVARGAGIELGLPQQAHG